MTESGARVGWCTAAPRFRTIQGCPKDLPVPSGQPWRAVSWHSGFRGGAHARRKTARIDSPARRSGDVAARGTGAAGRRLRSQPWLHLPYDEILGAYGSAPDLGRSRIIQINGVARLGVTRATHPDGFLISQKGP